VAFKRAELDALAELGALAGLGDSPERSERRAALWQVAALERDPHSLFAGRAPAAEEAAGSPLREMSPLERTLADYRLAGLTPGPQILAHLRGDLRRRGILSARELHEVPDGRFVRTAGHVIVRQRPGSAKGFTFLTLEDETGTSNAILTPAMFRRFRVAMASAPLVEIAGPLQNAEGVIHVRIRHLRALSTRPAQDLPEAHSYH
jgi:error-prone DNA polymerase